MKYADFLKHMKECPFCHDANRVIVESEKCFLTYSRWPYHKHHLLTIPKRHIESITELTQDERKDIDQMQEKALEVLKKLGYDSVTQLVREGNEINKSIRHVHFHTIPYIRIGDLDHFGQEKKMLTEGDISQTIEDVRKLLM